MQALAGERASGLHTFFVPPEHTREARERIGPQSFLAPELAVAVDKSGAARVAGREHAMSRARLWNYAAHIRRLGFDPSVTKASGKSRSVVRRRTKNNRLAGIGYSWRSPPRRDPSPGREH